ncbi:MAG: hypothetical protein WC322_04970 [Candidatus Paceibacterota bacterium]|jgi:hypothetical protein
MDVDTVKGCTLGMRAYPDGGCYGECYARKIAARRGFDFAVSVSRRFCDREDMATIRRMLNEHAATWYRVGTHGDPCHDWDNTIRVCKSLWPCGKSPVIVTKHWIALTDEQIAHMLKLKLSAVFNTSVSGMDTDDEIAHRVDQMKRLEGCGIRSVLRVVTCQYGTSEWARSCKERQDYLLSFDDVIDNPLRAPKSNSRVLSGDILLTRHEESVGGGKFVSLHCSSAYLGACASCPDQCGVIELPEINEEESSMDVEQTLWEDKTELKYVSSVIGSGYEEAVAELAIEDGIAHRAARKNMQIHSAVIFLVNEEFAGFMTFQNNHDLKEFCLLQSVIHPDHFSKERYLDMVRAVIEQNTEHYPAFMTTNPKSKFETPKLYNELGFETYLKMGEFHYMICGDLADSRFKLLAHMTMTNAWHSVKGDWLRVKREWNARIAEAGERESIPNPLLATREGCWGGKTGMSNVVAGKSHNQNASVLDPTACEVILRFFMPTNGKRVYNPFGGGVQFGFISGAYGYEYVASELRQNQCDANNKLCNEFPDVRWIQSDSSTYVPEDRPDLVFTCPPYYKVEKYVDYDGNPPAGELNTMSTYEEFRDALFAGYAIAAERLNDNRFFVVMTGDSRDKNGAYYCSEADTEMYLKSIGLSLYNKIVYLESEFTRLAQAKTTLKARKFPKCEQKIIVAYKGDMSEIVNLFPPIGRL